MRWVGKKGLLPVRQMWERKQLCLLHYHLEHMILTEFPKQHICHTYLNVLNNVKCSISITYQLQLLFMVHRIRLTLFGNRVFDGEYFIILD